MIPDKLVEFIQGLAFSIAHITCVLSHVLPPSVDSLWYTFKALRFLLSFPRPAHAFAAIDLLAILPSSAYAWCQIKSLFPLFTATIVGLLYSYSRYLFIIGPGLSFIIRRCLPHSFCNMVAATNHHKQSCLTSTIRQVKNKRRIARLSKSKAILLGFDIGAIYRGMFFLTFRRMVNYAILRAIK